MYTYKFKSSIRGIYRLDEFVTVTADSLAEAETKVDNSHFKLFTITK